MLTTEEIKIFIDEDSASMKKKFARTGERYFDGDHDILQYRVFYYNADQFPWFPVLQTLWQRQDSGLGWGLRTTQKL